MKKHLIRGALALALGLFAAPTLAASAADVAATRALLAETVAIPTVKGRGEVPRMAAVIRDKLIAAGFAIERVLEPMPEGEMLQRHPEWIAENKRPFCLPNPAPQRTATMLDFAGWVKSSGATSAPSQEALLRYMAQKFPCK